ncbi:MAG: hypothetical protein AAFQ35_05190, partial [Pseudomonadota bacterium]
MDRRSVRETPSGEHARAAGLCASPARPAVARDRTGRALQPVPSNRDSAKPDPAGDQGSLVDAGETLVLNDLCLLIITAFSPPEGDPPSPSRGGIDLAGLCREIDRLTGSPRLTDMQTARRRDERLADWQLEAISAALVTPVGSMRDAAVTEPRLVVTPAGRACIDARFGTAMTQRITPINLPRLLAARALGIAANAGTQRLARLDTAAGLRLAVVRRHHGLRVPQSSGAAEVRAACARRALGVAFGDRVVREMGRDTRMSAKAGRALAAQLLTKRRSVATDAQLITALAADALSIPRADLSSMRQALTRRLFAMQTAPATKTTTATDEKLPSTDDRDTLDATKSIDGSTLTASAFTRAVHRAAKLNASGWSGNRKAFISHVWRTICDAHPEWALDADSFKLRLAAAHRDGDLVLVNADL